MSEEDARKWVAKYEPLLKHLARRWVGFGVDDKDLLAVGRVAVLRAVESYVAAGSTLDSWVGNFCRWRMQEWVRDHATTIRIAPNMRGKVRFQMECLDEPLLGPDGEGRCWAEVIAAPEVEMGPEADVVAALRRAIETLKPRQRTAIELHYFQELTVDAVAERMGLTPMGVYLILRRARERLRQMSWLREAVRPGECGAPPEKMGRRTAA